MPKNYKICKFFLSVSVLENKLRGLKLYKKVIVDAGTDKQNTCNLKTLTKKHGLTGEYRNFFWEIFQLLMKSTKAE